MQSQEHKELNLTAAAALDALTPKSRPAVDAKDGTLSLRERRQFHLKVLLQNPRLKALSLMPQPKKSNSVPLTRLWKNFSLNNKRKRKSFVLLIPFPQLRESSVLNAATNPLSKESEVFFGSVMAAPKAVNAVAAEKKESKKTFLNLAAIKAASSKKSSSSNPRQSTVSSNADASVSGTPIHKKKRTSSNVDLCDSGGIHFHLFRTSNCNISFERFFNVVNKQIFP